MALERRTEPRLDGGPRREPQIEAKEESEHDNEPVAVSARKARPTKAPKRVSGGYLLPPMELLAAPKETGRAVLSADALAANATALEGVLGDFGVRGEIINSRPGPVVTLYELEPAPGIKSSRVIGLADDIARSMSALSARVAVVAAAFGV